MIGGFICFMFCFFYFFLVVVATPLRDLELARNYARLRKRHEIDGTDVDVDGAEKFDKGIDWKFKMRWFCLRSFYPCALCCKRKGSELYPE